jgi:hypothetical protein
MDLGSEIRDPEKKPFRIRVHGSKRHRIPDLDPQHCLKLYQTLVKATFRVWCLYS